MKSRLKALLIAALTAPCLAGAQGIVVFGTSLSDPGNAHAALGEANTPPDWSGDKMFLVPDQPYVRGGGHFSNGATWVEQFARPLGEARSVKPAFARGGGTNFAFGGARARAYGDSPDFSKQVGIFLQATGGVAPGKALYVVEMGGNDMRDALLAFAKKEDGWVILDEALKSIHLNVEALSKAGAQRFLIWNIPNIGLTPAINRDPASTFFADLLAQWFNPQLEERLANLRKDRGIEITVFDAHGKLDEVVKEPAIFGLDNAKDACISLTPPYACAGPNEYLFWDGIHPTAAGHAILAHEAARVLGR